MIAHRAARAVVQCGVRIAAVVLAAGEGRRIGGPKALLRIGGATFLERAVAPAAPARGGPR